MHITLDSEMGSISLGYRSPFWAASPLLQFYTLALCSHIVFSDKQGKKHPWVSYHETSQNWYCLLLDGAIQDPELLFYLHNLGGCARKWNM